MPDQMIVSDDKGLRKTLKEQTAGQTLKRIFRQDGRLSKIEVQVANRSLLMNNARMQIFIHLTENPCDHPRSISRVIRKSLNSVVWNLGKMLEGGLVEFNEMNGRKVFWPAGMVNESDLAVVALTRNEWFNPVMKKFANSEEPVREKHLVESLGAKQQNVHMWLKKMSEAGIIMVESKGKQPGYSVSENFIKLIKSYDMRSKDYMKSVIFIIKSQGLMPKKMRYSGTRLSMSIRLPGGHKRIHLECSPLAGARKLAKAQDKMF